MPRFNRTIRQWAKRYGKQSLMGFTAPDTPEIEQTARALAQDREKKALLLRSGSCALRRGGWVRGDSVVPYRVQSVTPPEKPGDPWTLVLLSAIYVDDPANDGSAFIISSNGVDGLLRARFPTSNGQFSRCSDAPLKRDIAKWRAEANLPPLKKPKPEVKLLDYVRQQLQAWKISHIEMDEGKWAAYPPIRPRFHFRVIAPDGPMWLLIVEKMQKTQRAALRRWAEVFGDAIVVAAKRSNTDGSIIYTQLNLDENAKKGVRDPVLQLEDLAPAGVDTSTPLPPLPTGGQRKPPRKKRGKEVVVSTPLDAGGADIPMPDF